MNLASSTLICIPVCETNLPALVQTVKHAAAVADLVELRLDYLSPGELENGASQLRKLMALSPVPLILTLRPDDQGGKRTLSLSQRLEFWQQHFPPSPHLADLELDLSQVLSEQSTATAFDWSRIISSYHQFDGPLLDFEQVYGELGATPAHILKIAFQANDVTDCLPVFDLLARARRDGRKLIAIAMDDAGLATRVLGPSRGSYLTYGSLNPESGSAPGQITAIDLREIYRIETISERTRIVGLVGLPTAHSVSPAVHNAAFDNAGIDTRYLRFEVRDLSAFIKRMVDPRSREFDWNLRGLSVTAPHKSAAIGFLDRIDPAAREIGAVNTIVLESNELHGYNTDAEGFVKPLLDRMRSLAGLRCAVIGSGGVARTAVWVLKGAGAKVKIFARQGAKAQLLADEFSVEADQLGDNNFSQFDLVVNATPVGTAGKLEQESILSAEQLRGAGFVYDLVYNPKETQLMREARTAGCDTLGGAAMLVTQAAAQFRLWTGTDAPIEVMSRAADTALQGSIGL